jgi:hypothetical protein
MKKLILMTVLMAAFFVVYSTSAMAQYPGNDNPCNIDFNSEACQIQCYYQPSMCIPMNPQPFYYSGMMIWVGGETVGEAGLTWIEAMIVAAGGSPIAGVITVGATLVTVEVCATIIYDAVIDAEIRSDLTDYCNSTGCSDWELST